MANTLRWCLYWISLNLQNQGNLMDGFIEFFSPKNMVDRQHFLYRPSLSYG